ncbi:hypothetical protein HYX11_00260 [Candidatus Woesearchaeota archaeon]|nr:hypothetical protein [Candidatus Woesearchaeota archaeon]
MLAFDTVQDKIVLGLVLLGIFFITLKLPKWQEQRREQRETEAAGPEYKKVRAGLESTRQSFRKKGAEEQVTRRQTPRNKAVTNAEKTSEKSMGVEEETAELAETVEAGVAALQNQATEIQTSLVEKTASLQGVGEKISEIESLKRKLQPLSKLMAIDQTTIKYLKKEYFGVSAQKLKDIIEAETTNEQHHRKFLDSIKGRINDLKYIEKFANGELNVLKKRELKEHKNFQKELKALKNAITDKYKQLAKEKSKGKNADSTLLAQLSKEIEMLQRNAVSLQELNEQIEKTYVMMELEITQLQQILKDVVEIVKNERKYSKTIDRREKELKNRLKEISKKWEGINKNIEQLNSSELLYPVILKYSQQIQEFYNFYITLLQEDFNFEQKLKDIVTQNGIIENKLNAFLKLLLSLNESEKAVDAGLESVLAIMNTIYTEDVKVFLQKERKNIEEAAVLIDYEEKIEKYLQALEKTVEQQNKKELVEIDALLEKEKENLAQVQTFQKQLAEELGGVMATNVNRKLALDENYMKQADKFAEQLKQRNETAAAAYNKVIS